MKEKEPLPKTWGKPVIKRVGYSVADSCTAYACEKGIYIENIFESCNAPSMLITWEELNIYQFDRN